MAKTIKELRKTFDFPAMFAQSGHPIIAVIPFSGKQPMFASLSPDRIDTMLDNWEKAATAASVGDVELEAEARERLHQIRLHMTDALAVFNPQTQRMVVKFDIYQFELCIEDVVS